MTQIYADKEKKCGIGSAFFQSLLSYPRRFFVQTLLFPDPRQTVEQPLPEVLRGAKTTAGTETEAPYPLYHN